MMLVGGVGFIFTSRIVPCVSKHSALAGLDVLLALSNNSKLDIQARFGSFNDGLLDALIVDPADKPQSETFPERIPGRQLKIASPVLAVVLGRMIGNLHLPTQAIVARPSGDSRIELRTGYFRPNRNRQSSPTQVITAVLKQLASRQRKRFYPVRLRTMVDDFGQQRIMKTLATLRIPLQMS
jgi:hypothetical protein